MGDLDRASGHCHILIGYLLFHKLSLSTCPCLYFIFWHVLIVQEGFIVMIPWMCTVYLTPKPSFTKCLVVYIVQFSLPSTLSFSSSHSCWPLPDCPTLILMSHCHHHHHRHHHYHHFKSRFHIWVKTCSVWGFELILSHSTWWSPVPSIFLQMT
jgi:hypothetical protein